MGFNVEIREILRDFRNDYLKMIEFKITNERGNFKESSGIPYIYLTDGTNDVKSFTTLLSGNKKEIIGYFTIDAFNVLPQNVTALFDDGSGSSYFIHKVDLNTKEPLYTIFNGIPHNNADSNWLSTL